MDLLIASNTVTLDQADKAPASGTPGWATDGDPATGQMATDAPAWHYNMMMAELIAIIKAAGITPSNADWSQVLKAMQTIFSPAQYGVAPYSASLAQLVGGYPAGAIVCGGTPGAFWVSTADANVSTPGADGAFWQSLFAGCVPTPADNSDPVNGRVTEFLYNKNLQQFVAFCPSVTASGNGMALVGSQTFGATGFSTLSNFVYRTSDGALQANVGSISAAAIVNFAPVSMVDTVQANLTTEQTARANANAALQSQIDGRVITPADNSDATNGNVDTLIFNKGLGQPVAFNGGVGYALPFSHTYGASGFTTIANMVLDTASGALTINYGNMSDGTTQTYLPASQGTIAANGNLQGGTWTKTGSQLRQCFQQLAWDTCTIDYPAGDYATTPTVNFTPASSSDGKALSVVACFGTLPTTQSFSPHLATFEGSTDIAIPESNPIMLHITVEGTAA